MVLSHSCYIYATCNSKEMGRRGQVLKPSYGWRGSFYGMLIPLDIMLTIFNLIIALLLTDDVNHHMHLFLTCTYSRQFQTFFSMSLKNLQGLLKLLDKMLLYSSSSKNKLYSTFAVYGMTSNLALISDKHKIKSAPKECISLRIPHVTIVRRHKIYSFLIIQVVFTFRGCTSSQLANTIS